MITAGNYHTLKVNRISEFGLYLADDEENEVLLPNRYVSKDNKEGDELTVFVYHDSEDRLVASTEHPLATVGQAAYLKVVDKTVHGAFLDWGIPAKDLFLPNRNLIGRVEIGKGTVVFLYVDNVTGRVVATNYLKSFVNNAEISVKPGEEVEILIASDSEIGYRVVINNKNWGMLYKNQIFRPVAIGDKMQAFVTKITEDNRIDVSLQKKGYDEIKRSADFLVELFRMHNGVLPLTDNSTPQEIQELTNMSKKVFKRTMGHLMKRGMVSMGEKETRLVDEE